MDSLELISRLPKKADYPTPLLFVHGAWHGAWCWDTFFLPYFAERGFDAHAISLRGHGKSSSKERLRWIRIKEYVADVVQIAQQFSQPPIVIGHSMGGFVVQKYLEQYYAPGGVLMASAPPKGVLRTTLAFGKRHPLVLLKTNLKMRLGPIVETPTLAREMLFSEEMPEATLSAYFNQLQDESYLAYIDMMGLNLPRPKRVKSPMLILGGTKDQVFTPQEVEQTAVSYNTAPHLFPMAHDMMLEEGWETVADTIIDWLHDINDEG